MNNKIRIAGIVNDSIVDGPGIRLTIFTQGCKHKCQNCHNPETHSIDGGEEMSELSIINMINENPLLDGITLSGGEPFLQAIQLKTLLRNYMLFSFRPVGVWLYTGFTWDQILENKDYKNLLQYIDVVIDGKFIESLKTNEPWKGSSNQRIINVRESIRSGNIILWNQ